MLNLDTSRPLRGHTQLAALAEAIHSATAEDEHHWLEWKSQWDLTSNLDRGHLARHILGMANRMPDLASRVVGGCGYVVLGVEPERCGGVARIDPATLEPQIQSFLGPDGPTWDSRWIEFKGEDVLVVIVDPPQSGDPPRTLRKEFGKYHEGTLFVRRNGATHAANSQDVSRLVSRSQANHGPSNLDVELSPPDGALVVAPIDVGETAIARWIQAERKRVLAPLAAAQSAASEGGPRSDDLAAMSSLALTMDRISRMNQQALGRYRRREDRTPEEYEAEVERYLEQAAEVLAEVAAARHIESGACRLSLALTNPTDHPWRDVSAELYIPGDGFLAAKGPDDNDMPNPPTPWGDRWVDPFALFDSGRMMNHPVAGPLIHTYPLAETPQQWVEIDNSGSARLSFSPVDLPPQSTQALSEVHLLVTGDLAGSALPAEWTARSTHASGVVEGSLVIDISDETYSADQLVGARS